jgi:hypothetical protein
MGLIGDVAIVIDRLLDRLPAAAEPVIRRASGKQKGILLNSLRDPHPKWRTLGALMREIGYDVGKERLQDRTEYLLRHLPPPDGPARSDRTTGSAQKPRPEQLWGLVHRVGP